MRKRSEIEIQNRKKQMAAAAEIVRRQRRRPGIRPTENQSPRSATTESPTQNEDEHGYR